MLSATPSDVLFAEGPAVERHEVLVVGVGAEVRPVWAVVRHQVGAAARPCKHTELTGTTQHISKELMNQSQSLFNRKVY